ncbi:MAG: hypothetical protein AB7S38_34265 [Vulcanimicrobiota bacterium]
MKRILQLLLCAFLLGLAGCEEGTDFGEGSNLQGNPNPGAVQPQFGRITINFNLLNREVPAEVTSFNFIGTRTDVVQDESGNSSPVTTTVFTRNDVPKEPTIILDNVPTDLTDLVIQFSATGRLIGIARLGVMVSPMGDVVINDPDFMDIAQDLADQFLAAVAISVDTNFLSFNFQLKPTSTLNNQISGLQLNQSENPEHNLNTVVTGYTNFVTPDNGDAGFDQEQVPDGSIRFRRTVPLTSDELLTIQFSTDGSLEPGDSLTWTAVDSNNQELGRFVTTVTAP